MCGFDVPDVAEMVGYFPSVGIQASSDFEHPIGEMNAHMVFDINRNAAIQLAQFVKWVGVPRFFFTGN